MSGIQCKCGRFLANVQATSGTAGEGYSWHEFLADVRGDCKRCGPDVQARRSEDAFGDSAWWWSADAWTWADEVEAA